MSKISKCASQKTNQALENWNGLNTASSKHVCMCAQACMCVSIWRGAGGWGRCQMTSLCMLILIVHVLKGGFQASSFFKYI